MFELAKKKLEEEFERFCESNPEGCSGCKYKHCDIPCEINYVIDNFYLIRKDDGNEN